jgi:hypothetical protein
VARLSRPVSIETRKKMSIAQRKRGAWPPAAGRPWTRAEEALLAKLTPAEVAKQTGRTLQAVYNRCANLRSR